MKSTNYKVIFSSVGACIASLLGVVAIPFYILVGCNIIDYITGITAAVYNGDKISSSKGFKGIVKKIAQWILVLVGFILDYSVTTLSLYINIDIKFNSIIALIVTFWLIFNELISILENLTAVDAPVPQFMQHITKHLQEATAKSVDIEE